MKVLDSQDHYHQALRPGNCGAPLDYGKHGKGENHNLDDLFIKVLRVLCPNVTAAFRRSFYDMSALPVSWLSLGSAQIAISWSIILWH